MMRKKFKLNDGQSITIKEDHELYNDIIIKIILGEDILPIIKSILIKQGYKFGNYYWHHYKHSPACHEIIPIIL